MKKAIVGGGVTALLLGSLIFGTDLWSVAKTGANNVQQAVKDQRSTEFEIQRAENMLQDLQPDIEACMQQIAEQQVVNERLESKVGEQQTKLASKKDTLLKLTADLEREDQNYVYAGVNYTRSEVEKDRALRWRQYQVDETALNTNVKILNARQMAVKANQEKLASMRNAQKELELQIQELKAHLEAVKAAETIQGLEFNDSQLSKTRELIDEISQKIEVREKLLDEKTKFNELIPIEEERTSSPEDLSNEIKSHFNTKGDVSKKSPGEMISVEKGSDSK